MEKIGLFWGSNTGNQEDAVKFLNDYMTEEGYSLDFLILPIQTLLKC